MKGKTQRRALKAGILGLAALMLTTTTVLAQDGYGNEPVIVGDEKNAQSVTYPEGSTQNSPYGTVEIPAGTVITGENGGTFDFTAFGLRGLSVSDVNSGPKNAAGYLDFGVLGSRLAFSQPVTIKITVGTEWNGRTLTIYRQRSGEKGWRRFTTCHVSNGLCVFTVDSTTKYFVSTETQKRYGTKSGSKYKLYKELEEDYHTDEYKLWYNRVSWYKRHMPWVYLKMKVAYELYQNHKSDPAYAKYYNDYKHYRRYVKFKEYKEVREYKTY